MRRSPRTATSVPAEAGTGSIPDDRLASLDAEITALAALDLSGLRLRWRNLMGRSAPSHLSKYLLYRILAYRIQAAALGDLDAHMRKALDHIAREQKRRATAARPNGDRPKTRTLKPGTVLVREWEGALHRVMVLGHGYAWNGETYASLSTVANAITGTKWSGPRFFGLLDKRAKPSRTSNVDPVVTTARLPAGRSAP